MVARLILGFIFVSSMLITRPVVAQSPYFDEYIDHAKFVELSPQDQRDFLVALMQTVADMEQKSIQAGHHTGPATEKKTVHQQRWDAVKKALKSFQDQLAISSAVAQPVPPYSQTCFNPGQASASPVLENGVQATCLFGSYRSTFVRSGNPVQGYTTYCQRPGCSINNEIRAAYSKVAQQGRCSKTQMACNPALFGYDNSGAATQKPTCIQIDINNGHGTIVNTVQNASLACLIAVANDQNKETRLNDIAKSIKDNAATAQEFNKLLHTVTNLCICDGSVGNNSEVPEYLRDMSNTYSKYVKDHRTCNALLSQTSEVLKRVSIGGGCIADILPSNVTKLSSDLNYINTYSSRFLLLARSTAGIQNGGALSQAQIHAAMARFSNRWVVENSFSKTTDENNRPILQSDITRVNEAGALDDIATYKQDGALLKNRASTDENRWCPLRFPDPVVAPVLNLTCEFSSATATRGRDGKVNVAATVAITGLTRGVTSTGISWTANGTAVAGQAGATLSAQNLEGIAADAVSVPVVATYTLSNGNTKECPGVASFPAAPVNNVPCEIKDSPVRYVGNDAHIAFTVEKNADMIPAATAMTVQDGDAPVTAGSTGVFEIIVPRSRGTVVLSASAASATAGGPALRCEKTVTLTPPENTEQPACELSIGEPTADPADASKLKATVSLPDTITEASAITWTPALTPASTEKSVILSFPKPAAVATQEIVATAVVTTPTGPVNCRGTKTITAPEVVAASAAQGCTLSVSVVAGEEGKYSVSATIPSATGTKAPKNDAQPVYTGLSFSTANNVGMAVVDSTRELQTKEITATYTDTENKNYTCKANAVIPAKAPAAGGGGGFAPQQQGPMVIPPTGQSLFKPGLR